MICKICNKNYEKLAAHLRYAHPNFSPQEYYDTFINCGNEGICKLGGCNNKTKFVSIKGGYLDHCCNSHVQRNEDTRNKINRTIREKYGSREELENIKKQKRENTSLKRYGDKNYNNKEKISQSLINMDAKTRKNRQNSIKEKWANKTPEEIKKIKNSRHKTQIKKYGQIINWGWAAKKKYGVTNISQVLWVKNKIINTWNNKPKEENNISNEKRKKPY